MTADMETANFWTVNHGAYASGAQLWQKVRREILPTKAVDRNIHLHATLGGTAKCTGDFVAYFVVGKNIAFEINFQLGRFDGGEQCRKILVARIKQR